MRDINELWVRMAEAEGAGGAPEADANPKPEGDAAAGTGEGDKPPSADANGPPSSPAAAKPSDNAPVWAQGRIDELTRNWRGTERQLQEKVTEIRLLEATVAELQKQNPEAMKGLSDQQIQAKAEELANQKVAQRTWDEQCNKLYSDGKSAFSGANGALDWDGALAKFKQAGGLPSAVIAAALDTDAPHEVLYELAQDLNEAAALFALTPTKMAIKLDRMANKIAQAKADAAEAGKKKASKAPAPISPEGGGNVGEELSGDPESWPSDKWHAWREKQIANQRANGRMLQ